MIKIDRLEKYYNKNSKNEIHVINDTTLSLGDTGLVCILGESGSGKTTLLNTIGGLDTFDGGSISVDEITLKKYKTSVVEDLRNRKYGYVFQNYYLLMDHSVEYNVRIALEIFDISEDEKFERVKYVLEAVGMWKYRKKQMDELSGGQQQRVVIARALAKAPDIIFADEPTGNLDEDNTLNIMGILKKISEKCLVVLVTHEKRVAEFYADRIITVQDGKIVDDYKNTGSRSISRQNDANIYLGEYKHENACVNGINLNVYTSEDANNASVNIVVKDGKLYIQGAPESNIVYISDSSETKLVSGDRPVMEAKDLQDFDYQLEKAKLKKTAKLSFRELLKISLANVKGLGKKQFFIFIALVLSAFMLAISLSSFYSLAKVNKAEIVSADSHYVSAVVTQKSFSYYEETNSIMELYNRYIESGISGELCIEPSYMIMLSSDKYAQYSDYAYSDYFFSYVSLDKIDKSMIIKGRMPEKQNEIVIDKMVADKIMEGDTSFAAVVSSYSDFFDLKVSLGLNINDVKIVGICDSNEMSVYMSKYMMLDTKSTKHLGTIERIRELFPGKYDDLQIGTGECIFSDYYYNVTNTYDVERVAIEYGLKSDNNQSFGSDTGYDIIVDESSYDLIVKNKLLNSSAITIYSDDAAQIYKLFMDVKKEFSDKYNFDISYKYGKEMDEYRKTQKNDMRTRNIITICVVAFSMILIFFMMKTNATNRARDLVVYRLIGIAPSSIAKAFAMEIIILITASQLPTIILTMVVLKALSILKIGVALECPFGWIAGLIGLCYIINVIIGMLPIISIIRRPPAKLADTK